MTYWRDCEICTAKGHIRPNCEVCEGTGKVDASAEIKALLDAHAARIEWLEGKLQAILDTMPPKVTMPLVIEIKEIAQEALKEAV